MARPKNPDYEYITDENGRTRPHMRIICDQCGESALIRTDAATKRFCSKRCSALTQHAEGRSRQASGTEHYAWKGNDAGYQALHMRVIRLRGSANRCELRAIARCTSVKYEWSHIHGTDPGDPQNYRSLCKSCHQRYDKQRGSDHASAKLSVEQVAAIRERYAGGVAGIRPRITQQGQRHTWLTKMSDPPASLGVCQRR